MRPFHEVDNRAQFRRLRPLAERALAAYALGPARLTAVQQVSNAVYRVDTEDGRRYALRVHNARWRDPTPIASELQWLEFIGPSGEMPVPDPVRAAGEPGVHCITIDGVPEPRLCTLLTWVPGHRIGKRITPKRIRGMGRLMARLHLLSRGFTAPAGFRRPHLDAAGLMGRNAALAPGWAALSPRQRAVFESVGERLEPVTARLDELPGTFGMLHGDFTLGNVLVQPGGSLALIDFDDCAWGYFTYELAVLLDWLEPRPDYLTLRAALLAGYREVRPVTALEIEPVETFLLARWVFLGLSFLSRPDHARFREYAPRFLSVVVPKLEAALGARR